MHGPHSQLVRIIIISWRSANALACHYSTLLLQWSQRPALWRSFSMETQTVLCIPGASCGHIPHDDTLFDLSELTEVLPQAICKWHTKMQYIIIQLFNSSVNISFSLELSLYIFHFLYRSLCYCALCELWMPPTSYTVFTDDHHSNMNMGKVNYTCRCHFSSWNGLNFKNYV